MRFDSSTTSKPSQQCSPCATSLCSLALSYSSFHHAIQVSTRCDSYIHALDSARSLHENKLSSSRALSFLGSCSLLRAIKVINFSISGKDSDELMPKITYRAKIDQSWWVSNSTSCTYFIQIVSRKTAITFISTRFTSRT